MRQIKTCLVCLLVLILCCVTVSAAGADYTLDYRGGDSDIVIQGTAGVEKANRQITLQVIREGADVSDPGFDPATDILFMRQVMTDVNGDFSFTFTIGTQGDHSIRISENGALMTGDSTFYRSTVEELADAVAQLNAAYGNAAAMDVTLNGNSAVAPYVSLMKVLQIDAAEYSALKTDAYFLANLAAKTYADASEFSSQYALSELLVELTRATTADEVKALLDAAEGVLDFSGTNAAAVFGTYTEAEQNSVYALMAAKSYADEATAKNAFYEAVIANEVQACDTYQAKFAVLEANNDVLGLALSNCANLGTYVEAFKEELATKPLNTIEVIRNNFSDLYSKYLEIKEDAEDSDSGRGGNGGGGGGASNRPVYIEVGNETAKSTTVPSSVFKDIDSVVWAKPAIEALAAKGVVAGKATGVFAPGDLITRAEFAKILFGAFGVDDETAETEFIDVPESHWAYKYIAAAYAKGLVNGVGEGVFGANDPITRQDIVTLCYRLTENIGAVLPDADGVEFDDAASIASYAKVAADKMKVAGIVNGKGNNLFDPTAPATRAEATKIIYEVMQFCQK